MQKANDQSTMPNVRNPDLTTGGTPVPRGGRAASPDAADRRAPESGLPELADRPKCGILVMQ